MTTPKVSIIILNWNGWEDTIECLKSVYEITYENYDVIILDNGSLDDSATRIAEFCRNMADQATICIGFDEHITSHAENAENPRPEKGSDEHPSTIRGSRLIVSDKNVGFAEGNNIAISYALRASNPDYVLLLNNDTVVDREFLSELVSVAESGPEIGIAGPKTYYYDSKGGKNVIRTVGCEMTMWKGMPRILGYGEIERGQYKDVRDVDHVSGACMLIRTDLIRKVGFLDSRLFCYWEENDYCYRSRRIGYRTVVVPDAVIWHKMPTPRKGRESIYYLTRNRLWIVGAYAERRDLVLFMIYYFTWAIWFNSGYFIIYRRDLKELAFFWKGIIDGIAGQG